MSGTAELSVNVTPRDARQALERGSNKRGEFSTRPPGVPPASVIHDGCFVWRGFPRREYHARSFLQAR